MFPEYRIVSSATKIYGNPVKKTEKLMLPMLKFIRRLGQGQLIRRHIMNVLKFGCEMDAHLLHQVCVLLLNMCYSYDMSICF